MTCRVAALLGALIGSACVEPTVPVSNRSVEFTAERDTYMPGESVVVRLVNRSGTAIAHSMCFAFLELERLDDSAWISVKADLGPGNAACDLVLYHLPPAGQVQGTAYLPRNLPEGRYRLSTTVEAPRHRLTLVTQGFTVGRMPD